MYSLTKEQFVELAKQGNVIPVYREMLADFESPLSAYLKVESGDFSYLLESVESGERLGRYSFLGSKPSLVIESKDKNISLRRGEKVETYETKLDPIAEIKRVMQGFKFVTVDGLPRFCGGLVGYIGYDMVRFFEDIPDQNPDDFNMPDMQFVLTDTILIFDHVDHKIKVVSNAIVDGSAEEAYEAAIEKIDQLVEKLQKPPVHFKKSAGSAKHSEIESNFSKEEFGKIVEEAKEHIRAGDIIQVVLSQRFERKTDAEPFNIYRALRSINPSPYMYYLNFGDCRVIGSSPEILVRCEDEVVEVRPIAGTRRRGKDEAEDIRMEEELLSDPKERAEHIMLVDLGRNDIGRVCDFSTVVPREVMRIERYSHVMHIVSDVEGRLSKGKDIFDLIRATFPAGTVTGAPKVKAMELIDKFENKRRGSYAGCVGYISFSGNMDLCITIRTVIMKDKTAYVQAGAGIVLDSDPAKEYLETQNKAKAMMKAIEFAEGGLE